MREFFRKLDTFQLIALLGVGLGLAFNLVFLIKSLPVPILEQHSFRQTQTAITAYWLIHGTGDIFRYETPALGYPWSIPMEFPVYQFIVAKIAVLFGLNLDATGRTVSFIFNLLTVVAGYFAVQRLKLGRWFGVVFAALYLCSPIYIFWGRTFMIETCATFFGMLFVCMLCYFVTEPKPRRRWALFYPAALAAGIVCVMAKATTFPGFAAAGGFVFIVAYLRRQAVIGPAALLASLGSLVLLPLIPAYYWVVFSDQVKMNNLAGQTLTSTALKKWNFGTFDQRLSKWYWGVVLGRAVRDTLGYHLTFLALLWGFWRLKYLNKLAAAALFGLYLLPFLIFGNVQPWHNYYQVANAVFLIVAAVVVICSLRDQERPKAATRLLIFVLIIQLTTFSLGFYRSLSETATTPQPTIAIADFIKGHTEPNTAIIVFGYSDWSSEIAYYAERKSLSVPNWFTYDKVLRTVDLNRKEMGGLPISAIVDGNNTRDKIKQEGKYDLFAGYRSAQVAGVTVYY